MDFAAVSRGRNPLSVKVRPSMILHFTHFASIPRWKKNVDTNFGFLSALPFRTFRTSFSDI